MPRRAFINKKMNPNIANLKKRKLLPGAAEDLELPSAKHICCETVADSEYDISCMSSMVTEDDVSVVDTQADSTQESKSFHGDAQSAKVDASVENTNSYDEASTVSDHSGSSSSGNGSVSFGSSIIGNKKDGKEAEQCHNEDTSWHIDGLEECTSTQYCHDSSEPTAGVLHDFLSSSGVDPNIYVLSSEILGVDQETPPGRSKPTIDQEFEQYFSMLML